MQKDYANHSIRLMGQQFPAAGKEFMQAKKLYAWATFLAVLYVIVKAAGTLFYAQKFISAGF